MFIARYRGNCADCDEGITPGEECEYRGDGENRVVVHITCPTPPEPVPPCTTCWLIHPEGACDA